MMPYKKQHILYKILKKKQYSYFKWLKRYYSISLFNFIFYHHWKKDISTFGYTYACSHAYQTLEKISCFRYKVLLKVKLTLFFLKRQDISRFFQVIFQLDNTCDLLLCEMAQNGPSSVAAHTRAQSFRALPCSGGTLKVSIASTACGLLWVNKITSLIGKGLESQIFSAMTYPTQSNIYERFTKALCQHVCFVSSLAFVLFHIIIKKCTSILK